MTAEVVRFPHPVARSAAQAGNLPSTVSTSERDRDERSAELVSVASALRDASPRILDNWAIRVSTMPLFRAIPHLTLADLRQRMPEVLDAALLAVTSSAFAVDLMPLDDAIARGEEHGRARSDVASLDVVLAEFHALRREVRSQLWRVADALVVDHGRREQIVRDLDDRLTTVLDGIEQAAAVAWVDACDADRAVSVMAS